MSSSAADMHVIPYTPHMGGQYQFHLARDKRNRALACGARFGKDRCTVVEAWTVVSMMAVQKLREEAKWRSCVPLVHCWVVAPDYPRQKQFWRELLHYIPEHCVTKVHNVDYMIEASVTGDGKPQIVIELKSAKDPRALVSVGLDLLVMTEAALIKDEAWNYYLQPRLMSPGRCGCVIANGTPKGRNWYYSFFMDCLKDPVNSWALQAPSWANPFIDRSWIKRMRGSMPRLAYRQEIKGEFVTATGGVFEDCRPLTRLRFAELSPIIIGMDLGKRHDASVFLAMSSTGQMIGMERVVGVPYLKQKQYIDNIINYLLERGYQQEDIVLAPERNSVGEVVYELLQSWYPKMVHMPFTTSNPSKKLIIDELALDMEQQKIALLDEPQLLNELDVFEYVMLSNSQRYSAPDDGVSYDDCVMALAIANHVRNEVNTWGHRSRRKWRGGVV